MNTIVGVGLFALVLSSGGGCAPTVFDEMVTLPEGPGSTGTFASLTAGQRQLVASLSHSPSNGPALAPSELYDASLLSQRTTFEAITQALALTSLTDESGNSLGKALSLIHSLEDIRGEVRGDEGDTQFRLYVRLHADGRDRLERSREFARADDHSQRHAGYPINYRQLGGVPSLQFSLSTDHRRADIDVDYRTDVFPWVVFNGHTAPENSDVRFEHHYELHLKRWRGLQAWWR